MRFKKYIEIYCDGLGEVRCDTPPFRAVGHTCTIGAVKMACLNGWREDGQFIWCPKCAKKIKEMEKKKK